MTISGIIASGRTRLLQLLPLFVTVLAAFVIVAGSRAWSGDEPDVVVSDGCSDVCATVATSGN